MNVIPLSVGSATSGLHTRQKDSRVLHVFGVVYANLCMIDCIVKQVY